MQLGIPSLVFEPYF